MKTSRSLAKALEEEDTQSPTRRPLRPKYGLWGLGQ